MPQPSFKPPFKGGTLEYMRGMHAYEQVIATLGVPACSPEAKALAMAKPPNNINTRLKRR